MTVHDEHEHDGHDHHDHDHNHDHGPSNRRFGIVGLVILMFVVLVVIAVTAVVKPGGVIPTGNSLTITVNEDGSFTPETVHAQVGDEIKWVNLGEFDRITQLPNDKSDACTTAVAYDENDENAFSTPRQQAVPGIWIKGGSAEAIPAGASCDCGGSRCSSAMTPVAGNEKFCPIRERHTTFMEELWTYPWSPGLLAAIEWSEIEPGEDTYDWTFLDETLNQAVSHGKSVALSLTTATTGNELPAWLFTTGGVTPVPTKDTHDGKPTAKSCGDLNNMGSPSDEEYRKQFNDLLTDVAAHINSNTAWRQAVTRVHITGMNNGSSEGGLPRSCNDIVPTDGVLDTVGTDQCVCNTKLWAEAGYTPDELYEFYAGVEDTITQAFGDVTMSYPLLQAGFPKVVSETNFEGDTLKDQDGNYLVNPPGTTSDDIGGTVQTQTVIDQGTEKYGNRFLTMHLGLDRYNPDLGVADCTYGVDIIPPKGDEPAHADFPIPFGTKLDRHMEDGCPNLWATRPGVEDGLVTGFQNENEGHGVVDPASIESELWNMTKNSNGILVEIGPDRAWEIQHLIGPDEVMDPERFNLTNNPAPYSKTPLQWFHELIDRRNFFDLPEVFPSEHKFTFSKKGTYTFTNPRTCSAGQAAVGTIVIE